VSLRNFVSAALVFPAVFVVAALALGAGAASSDNGVVEVRFRNHHFSPANLEVPAGQALTIKVVNASSETIEFESFRLNREISIRTFHREASSPSDRSRRVSAGARILRARRSTDYGEPHKPSALFRSAACRAGANRDASHPRLLRLPFQPNAMALVQPGCSGFMAGRPRRRPGTQRTQLLRVGFVLPADPDAKASMDGPDVARARAAAVELPPDASCRAA